MEDFVTRSLLFDFYGELLTEHQRRIYASIIFEDLSVSEVAREEGISRQGVHDLMKRCTRVLEDYEERLTWSSGLCISVSRYTGSGVLRKTVWNRKIWRRSTGSLP